MSLLPYFNHFIPALTTEILLFGLLVSGNYIGELFSCSIQRSFTKNRLYKHVLGILTLYFFITALKDNTNISPLIYMVMSVITYTWFVIITLTPKLYTKIIVGLLIFLFILNDIDNHYKFLTPLTKFTIYFTLFSLAICLSIYGCYQYFYLKRKEFGRKFDINKFIFGINKC